MSILSRIASAMQDVLTEKADIIAKETQQIRRQRKVSGSNFIQTLVFGWNGAKKTSSSIRFQVRWNLTNGQITQLYIHPGKEHERSVEMECLPEGSLRIADLGYFSLDDFQKMEYTGCPV